MATVYGVNHTISQVTGATPSTLFARGSKEAPVHVSIDTYEASALATSSTIKMCDPLPKGARVIGYQLAYDALSTVSIALGDSASSTRYLASVDTANTAGIKQAILVDGVDYVIGTASGDNQIIISTTGVSAATGTIKLVVFYTQA